VSREAGRWDALYARGLRGAARSPAEADSVPVPARWGWLPPSEWEASASLLTPLTRAGRWLDLGCGTGSVLAAFLHRVPGATGVGIDASEVAVRAGLRALAGEAALAGRMALRAGDLRDPPVEGLGPFDLVYALFSLQFLRAAELDALAERLPSLLAPGGVFAGTVRSTARSVPASYEPLPGEPNTYLSHEPHESGMIYRHYGADDIHRIAPLLGGRVEWLAEKRSFRDYDPAPVRAWWDFVITRP
jgi:SAM-dependent methyltransferase